MAAAPVVEPPEGNPRFPLVDSLRAVAALSVFALHAGVFSNANVSARYGEYLARGDIGVTIFFVISGFLLYRPFVAARLGQAPAPRLATYLRRRALRIVPAYWLALVLLATWPGLPGMWEGGSWRPFLLVNQFSVTASGGGLPQAWSLAVEVSFYVALPVLALLIAGASRRAAGVRSEIVMLALLWAGSVVFRLLLSHGHVPLVRAQTSTGVLADPAAPVYTIIPRSGYSSLFGAFDWFAIGMGLAVASAATRGRESASRLVGLVERHPNAPWVLAAAIFLLAPVTGVTARFPHPYGAGQWYAGHALYGVIGGLLLLPAVFEGDGRGISRRLLRNRALAWLGLVSYGIYLWHLTILFKLDSDGPQFIRDRPLLLGGAAGLVLTVAAAALSYYLVERPLLRLKRGSGR